MKVIGTQEIKYLEIMTICQHLFAFVIPFKEILCLRSLRTSPDWNTTPFISWKQNLYWGTISEAGKKTHHPH